MVGDVLRPGRGQAARRIAVVGLAVGMSVGVVAGCDGSGSNARGDASRRSTDRSGNDPSSPSVPSGLTVPPAGNGSATTGATGTTTGRAGDAPADVVAFVQASDRMLVGGTTFAFALHNSAQGPSSCAVSHDVAGTIDSQGQIATFDLLPGGPPELVITKDTYFVRGGALPGWTLDQPWLSVPLDLAGVPDGLRRQVNTLAGTTGVSISPTFWTTDQINNPAIGLSLVRGGVTAAQERGTETIRGTATTRFDLTIDPELIARGAVTTTTGVAVTVDAATARAYRQSFLDRFGRDLPGAPLPDEAIAAYLGGDTEALVTVIERRTGTTVSPKLRRLIEQLSIVDNEDISKTSNPMIRAATTASGSVWIDGQGMLRRFDLTVDPFGFDPFHGTTTSAPASAGSFLSGSSSVEYFDVGKALTTTVPLATEVQPFATLTPDDVPQPRSSC